MILIALLTAWELVYNTLNSVTLWENDGSIIAVIIWFLLKLTAVFSFIFVAFFRKEPRARKINFITYTFTQIAEIILVCVWFMSVWIKYDYKCTFAANNCTPSGPCQECYILMYPIFYLVLAIPFKIWFSCTTFRYYQISKTTTKIRNSLLKVNYSSKTYEEVSGVQNKTANSSEFY